MKSILFTITRPPYKSENPKLAITHAMACYLADIHTDEPVEPIVAFICDGVLNCIKDQKSEDYYGIISTEQHIKNQLASDMKMLVCKEDLDMFGIEENRLIDAKDMGANVSLEIVPFDKIMEEMKRCDHLMFF